MIDFQTSSVGRAVELGRRFLADRRLPFLLALLIAALYWPALDNGWQVDDHFHRAAVSGVLPGGATAAWDLFDFARLDSPEGRHLLDMGLLPWWSQPDARLSFLRPVSGLSHGLDYLLWPRSPRSMHVHSVLWFVAAACLAWTLYRRLLGPSVAGLAALILAVDDTFAMAVGWLANRNAVVALVFGLGALLAHDSWRRRGSRTAAVLAPLCVLAAVLANEGAVSVGAYLLAYAAFLDRGPRRWLALLPSTVAGVLWAIAYRAFDYGIHGSGIYIDPVAEPGRFLAAAAERLPLLLWGQWAFPSPEIRLLLAPPWDGLFVALGGLAALLLVPLLWPLRRDPASRFFAAGMVLSLIPACSTFAANRLLFFVGIGGAGLIARLIAHAMSAGASRWRLLPALGLVLFHLVLAPAGLGLSLQGIGQLDRLLRVTADSLPEDPEISGQTLILVDAPSAFVVAFSPVLRALEGGAMPDSIVILASGLYGAELERLDHRTVAVRPRGGYLPPLGAELPVERPAPISLGRGIRILDSLYRAAPFSLGEQVRLPAATVEITQLTADGRAAEATFRFAELLDHPGYRWLCWKRGGGYEACSPPAAGEVLERASMLGPGG